MVSPSGYEQIFFCWYNSIMPHVSHQQSIFCVGKTPYILFLHLCSDCTRTMSFSQNQHPVHLTFSGLASCGIILTPFPFNNPLAFCPLPLRIPHWLSLKTKVKKQQTTDTAVTITDECAPLCAKSISLETEKDSTESLVTVSCDNEGVSCENLSHC
jgi:hypothetical protein